MNNRLLFRFPTLALGLVLVVTMAFFVLTHEGLYDLDDYLYARYAHALASGTYRPLPDPQHLLHDPLQERLLIFGPVAALYRLLGVNIISTTLWPLLCTLGCAVIIWQLYRRREPMVAAGALLLLGLHYFTLNLSTYLYPDNILMFWALAGAAALLVGRRAGQLWPAAWGAGFAGLSFAALLSKETIVFYLPFYLGLLALDAWRRQHGRFWRTALLMGAGLLATYLLYYQLLTGDILYRYHIIEQTNAYMRDGNYVQGRAGALLGRVTWEPLAFFVTLGMGVMLALMVAAGFGQGRQKLSPASTSAPADETGFWVALAASTLAFYWWGSTSLHEYNPISLQARMVTPLLPPLALAAGFGLRNLWQSGRGSWLLGLVLLGFAGWLHNGVSVLYGGLGLLLLALAGLRYTQPMPGWLTPGTAGFGALLLGVLTLLLLVRPVYYMRKPSVSAHFAQARLLKAYLPASQRGVVFTDDFLLRHADFYYDFRPTPTLRYERFVRRDSVPTIPGETSWLLLNRSTLTNDELTRKLIRYSADSMLAWFPRRRLLAQYGPVELYEVIR